jgi:hypothetical protein
MQKFEIVLRNDKVNKLVLMNWLIILLNFLLLIYITILQASEKNNYPFFGAALLLIIILFRLITGKKNRQYEKTEIIYFVIIATWLVSGFYWIALIDFILFILQIISKRKLIVNFDDDGIEYPSFPKKKIRWLDLNNVILKEGLLTIDLKDNRLFQNQIISPINEAEFNEFCRKELLKRRSNDKNDNDL